MFILCALISLKKKLWKYAYLSFNECSVCSKIEFSDFDQHQSDENRCQSLDTLALSYHRQVLEEIDRENSSNRNFIRGSMLIVRRRFRDLPVPLDETILHFATVDLGRGESIRMTVDVKLPGMFRRRGSGSLASESAPPSRGTKEEERDEDRTERERPSPDPARGSVRELTGYSLANRPEISF